MDNKLMFASGSFELNPKGQSALEKLADVLVDNKDINILVEGHTDSVPYGGSGKLVDNWDLSAKRATSIVRILTKDSKIDPAKITAAGRGEFSPIESNATPEGRAKNRRTEIILMPDLSKLYEIVK
jgi:chemotaxis protein MotB